MSAIWGIVALRPGCSVPEHSAHLFESTYQKSCKIDRYESVSATDALFGCGIQYITKKAEQEQLPFRNSERGILFTADCILDNRPELIDLLSHNGYEKGQLAEAPDGTLMYYAYLTFGNECVTRFRGLFSIAIWEERSRALTLISDHTAARSLYYTVRNGLLAFSTRMEPLLKLFPNVTPNVDYHKDFLLANSSVIYVVPGETPYREISLMTPATRYTVTDSHTDSVTYWTPGSTPSKRCRSANEYSRHFLELYNDCVKDSLRTNGEVGILMSSGMDSTSIGVLAAKELDKEERTLHSYTFTPFYQTKRSADGAYIYDESGLVREIASQYPNIKTTFFNNEGKNLFSDMKLCCNILEMPYKLATFPNYYEICRDSAKHNCKVLLNGAFGNRSVSFGHIQSVLYDFYCKKKFFSFFSLTVRHSKYASSASERPLRETLRSFRSFRKYISNPFAKFIPENMFLSPGLLRDYDIRKRFSRNPYALFTGGYVNQKSFSEQLNPYALFMYSGVFETQFGLHTGMLLRDPTKDMRILSFCQHLPFSMYAYHGIPRWLIRNTFTSLIPPPVSESWSRRGLLNIDWIQRVRRDWMQLKPELLQHLSTGLLDSYIDKERAQAFLESFDTSGKEASKLMAQFCAIEGLLRFLLPEEDTTSSPPNF